MNEDDVKFTAEDLKNYLTDANLSQARFGRIIGMSTRQINRMIAGEAPVPKLVGLAAGFVAVMHSLRKSGNKNEKPTK